jgi:hypothetical protein
VTTRQDLLTHWNQQLTLAEEAELATVTWRQRIRRRLYRFLLAMYGKAAWSGSPEAAEEVTDHPMALLVSDEVDVPAADENGHQTAGKAPRTRAEILRGLKNVRGLSDRLAPPGPLQDGLPPDAPVVIAAFKKRPPLESLVRKLQRAGFVPRVRFQGKQFQVFVSAADAHMATQIVGMPSERSPTVPRPGSRNLWPRLIGLEWYSLISGVLGVTLTAYIAFLRYLEVYHPEVTSLPTPESIAIIGAAAITVDTMFFTFLWTLWKWRRRMARVESSSGDSQRN